MNDRIQKWLADNSIKALLRRILSAVVLDKKDKEEPWKKLQEAIPKEIVGSLNNGRVPGSPLVWAGGTDPYIMNVETGQHIKDWGMNKKALQSYVKEIKAKVNELNGKTAEREAKLQANLEKKQLDAQKKDQIRVEEKAKEQEQERIRLEKEEKKKEAEKERQEKYKRFKEESGLDGIGSNNLPDKWCSEFNRNQHVYPNGELKHQDDFMGMTEQDVLEFAKKLGDSIVDGKKILGYAGYDNKGRHTICRYNAQTRDYIKMNAEGLVTIFKLNGGRQRFEKIKAKEELQRRG